MVGAVGGRGITGGLLPWLTLREGYSYKLGDKGVEAGNT
jgi:hypothetical protein